MKYKIVIPAVVFSNGKQAFKPPLGYIPVRVVPGKFDIECWLFPLGLFVWLYYFITRIPDAFRLVYLTIKYYANTKRNKNTKI